MNQSPRVVSKDPENMPAQEILAESIVRISESVAKLKASGLNQDAIIALIKDDTGFGKGTIQTVLDSLAGLKKKYCR